MLVNELSNPTAGKLGHLHPIGEPGRLGRCCWGLAQPHQRRQMAHSLHRSRAVCRHLVMRCGAPQRVALSPPHSLFPYAIAPSLAIRSPSYRLFVRCPSFSFLLLLFFFPNSFASHHHHRITGRHRISHSPTLMLQLQLQRT